ncbi:MULTISPECIES: hypothetical protein [Runella]|uniref:Uncharacterized protein n=1 Tax=Runella defluvii TaxID=370973 RepID=A0A7W6EQQ1_9BACT|nr:MULTISPECIES: hypothetical protein [Runella]MBB3838636.1 hypothetical protein [Runella defluvii]MCA0229113.1 hypothetical protein [Bacteroidota bacterium]
MNNPFFDIDPDDKVPESLKKAIVSEIDTIRNTMELVTLYVGHFFSAAGAMASNELNKAVPNQDKTSS